MSYRQSPSFTSSSPPYDHHILSKRKLDDYAAYVEDDEDSYLSELVSVRMRRDGISAVRDSSNGSGGGTAFSGSPNLNQVAYRADSLSSPSLVDFRQPECTTTRVQFFIKLISGGNTLVVHANSDDTVGSLLERLHVMTGIPVFEQRLIYRGRELQWDQSLAECSIQNDAGLTMVARMRSTRHPAGWNAIDCMISKIYQLCKGEGVTTPSKYITDRMSDFFSRVPEKNIELQFEYMHIVMASWAPTALVTLYTSTIEGNRECAKHCIKYFLTTSKSDLTESLYIKCAPTIIIEFCKLLRQVGCEDPLYLHCRNTLASLLTKTAVWNGLLIYKGDKEDKEDRGDRGDIRPVIVIQDLFPFVSELANRLSKDLAISMEIPASKGPLLNESKGPSPNESKGPSSNDVRDLVAFLPPIRRAIVEQAGSNCPISMPLNKIGLSHPWQGKKIGLLYVIFVDLLFRMDNCLEKMEDRLRLNANAEGEDACTEWSQYLVILKELNSISKLYQGAEEKFWGRLTHRKASLSMLIIRYAKRTDDNQWLFDHKEVTNFESRRHLAMMLLPDVREDYDELHEMLIDRSQLLSESFEYIARADPDSLHGGLFLEFKNEEATGPGVLREWFILVCQAIFNPQNALFAACPNDRRRFYPNPSSKVDPMHLEYFSFSGRVIALALMHRVQVGIVFDRVFFLQLAGMQLSVEDIREADPLLYNSCKQILEMDAEFIDSDGLGLTFVTEVEELGSRKAVELCLGGKNIVVNSKNREEYVDLLIQHRFVTSISEQVSHFAQGFADILSKSDRRTCFFHSLELQDLDWMLFGTESAICVDDWKAHTDFNGYTETDPQILWFWKIVGEMSEQQKKVLLFFWTSVKYLPVEGFRGLASRLYIYKSSEPHDRLPSSHTCFYRFCFPPYPSEAVMQDRLRVITQEHVGCSFGTW
ncbi:E3 ubiquitin-protein ligase UPL5 [Tripterygium wilfordii]|uniref:HECT-type E3 ubiquitin transferase n=1 Tax=Tripterygium wilfordii TaxID=458696 RepID=A0A7J7D7B1_TRIWF|nr:E3 ubiquitin-protein ligase UPL5-like [Tripterygium wilfordii]KAF5742119.1 E3 ubiquitin-protein ligase UPL5 [Tripterygium wilfordii]